MGGFGPVGSFPFGTHVFGPGAGTSTGTGTGTIPPGVIVCPGPDLTAMVHLIINEVGFNVFWPQDQVADAINEALVEMETIAFYPVVQSTITFNAGQDLVQWPSTSLVWPQYLELNGREYWIAVHAELERWDRNWRTTTPDQPRNFILWDEQHIRPYPLADQTYVFNIWGPGWPTEITPGNTDAFIPGLLKTAIAFRAAAALFQYSRPDLSAEWLKSAEENEARYRVQWRKQQSHNIKRLRPGTALTHAQGGNIRIGKRIDGNPSNPYR